MAKQGIRSALGSILVMLMSSAQAAGLKAGDPAPSFELRDQDGEVRRLSDYRGQWLVLYFYPKDDTPGCTSEACAFRDEFVALKQMDVAIVGVSLDDVASHQEFAGKYHLPFPLLSDPEGEVARSYGSLWRLGPIRFAKRHSFIIDPGGNLVKIYRTVSPKQHSSEIIRDLEALRP